MSPSDPRRRLTQATVWQQWGFFILNTSSGGPVFLSLTQTWRWWRRERRESWRRKKQQQRRRRWRWWWFTFWNKQEAGPRSCPPARPVQLRGHAGPVGRMSRRLYPRETSPPWRHSGAVNFQPSVRPSVRHILQRPHSSERLKVSPLPSWFFLRGRFKPRWARTSRQTPFITLSI